MNIRHKLADWISGGALTRAKSIENSLVRERDNLRIERDQWRDEWRSALEDCDQADIANAKLIDDLQSIIACETPGANATVKRMARIAREALK